MLKEQLKLKIKISHLRFAETTNKTLGRKMSTGAMPKAQALAVTLKTIKAKNANPTNDSIGFESVFDSGYESDQVFCNRCGFKSDAHSTDDVCLLCGWHLFSRSSEKFSITCNECNKPFYKEKIFIKKENRFTVVCRCYEIEKEQRNLMLREVRWVNKTIADFENAVEYIPLANLDKVTDTIRSKAYSNLDRAIITLTLNDCSRIDRRALNKIKFDSAKVCQIDYLAKYERKLLSSLVDTFRSILTIDFRFRVRGSQTLTDVERKFYREGLRKLLK